MIFSNFSNVLVPEKEHGYYKIVIDDKIVFPCSSSEIQIKHGLNKSLRFEFNLKTKSFWIKEKQQMENVSENIPNDLWLLLSNKPNSGFKHITSQLQIYNLNNLQHIGQFVKWSVPHNKIGTLCRLHPDAKAIFRIVFDSNTNLPNTYLFIQNNEIIECADKSKEFQYALGKFELPFNALWTNQWKVL